MFDAKKIIPITRAIFDEEEKNAIVGPLETGWVVQGKNVAEFEKQFSEFVHTPYAKAVSNCTVALHLALVALGVGPGDKVVVPSFTYVASANAIEMTGAKVIFCDIDLKTFNINTSHLEKILENNNSVKAIMPVNLFGLCADMQKIIKMAEHHKVKVVEDSACGFDAWLDKRHSGTFSNIGCFSFHPRKSITTGEGGMLIMKDKKLFHSITQLCDHGASKSDFQRHKEKGGSLLPDFPMRGYNYRMTDFQGAIGVCQMKKAASIMQGRRRIAGLYDDALKNIDMLTSPLVPDGYIHGYQSYVCLFMRYEDCSDLTIKKIDELNIRRNIFMDKLESKGIATRQGTHAVHTLSYYKNNYHLSNSDFLMSYAADRLSIALPLYADMSNSEFDYVISHIKQAFK